VPYRARHGGFTYLGLIFLVAIIALVGAAGLKVGTLFQRAAAEEDLLFIGAAFSDALESYAAATPQGQPAQPPTLQDLLKDPRFPGTRRHLRKIFVDPMTGKAEWGVLYLGDKVGVIGIYSLSQAKPLKVANFDARFLGFENKEKISDWKFVVNGQSLAGKTEMTGAPVPALPPQAPLVPPAPAEPADPAAASASASASAAATASAPAAASTPAPTPQEAPPEPPEQPEAEEPAEKPVPPPEVKPDER